MTAPRFRTFHQRLAVPFDYPVIFTRRLFDPANPILTQTTRRLGGKPPHRVHVCMDGNVARHAPGLTRQIAAYFRHHGSLLEMAGPIEIIRRPHDIKRGFAPVERAIRSIARRKLDRHSYVMIIGGGSLLDAVGLAASLVHRGLRVIRVPTTVTAQNDVGVGVKTGVDAFGAKNFLGTFAPPFAVLNDLDFLAMLPLRDRIAGLAEAFKVAMIKDRRFFADLCREAPRLRRGERAAMESTVIRCARLHMDHIRLSGDPFEAGSARPLDFGHWSSHHLEIQSQYRLRHGEAVAIGIALDACIACDRKLISPSDRDRLIHGLAACGLPVWNPLLLRADGRGRLRLLEGLRLFREHLGGELTLTLPGPVGSRVEIHELPADALRKALGELERLAAALAHSRQRRRRHAAAR